jgi:hypothetical protein
MTLDALTNHWALIAATVPALIAALLIVRSLVSRTAAGKLRGVLKDYREAKHEFDAACKTTEKTMAHVEKLTAKAGNVVPRKLQEASDAAEDARSLEKIAHDRVLVVATQVREIIHEEFPPVKQEKLRAKYLPQE